MDQGDDFNLPLAPNRPHSGLTGALLHLHVYVVYF